MKDSLLNLALPPDLSKERWLICSTGSADVCVRDFSTEATDLTEALIQRGAHLTFTKWEELTALAHEKFSSVVCYRLFESVRHPLLALESLCAITQHYALLHVVTLQRNNERALLCWSEPANGWLANRTALARMVRSAGFAHVQPLSESAEGLWLKASRQWPDGLSLGESTLTLHRAFNPVTGRTDFPRTGRRAFLALWVTGLPRTVARWELRLCVGGFGIQPIQVAPVVEEDAVQINAPLPPGLPTGPVTVRVWYQRQRTQEITIEIVEGTAW